LATSSRARLVNRAGTPLAVGQKKNASLQFFLRTHADYHIARPDVPAFIKKRQDIASAFLCPSHDVIVARIGAEIGATTVAAAPTFLFYAHRRLVNRRYSYSNKSEKNAG